MAFTGKSIKPIVNGGASLGSVTKGWGGAFITNVTASSATQGGKLVLAADDGAVMASGHRLGVIEFKGAEDTSSTLTIGARIEALADVTWSADDNGASLKMYTTDANASESLVLTLDSNKLATFTGDIALYDATNDGNPTISLGSSATDRLEIKSVYNSGAQTLCDVDFTTYTGSSTTNDGRFNFYVDEVLLGTMNDGGLYMFGNIQSKDADGTVAVIDTTTSSATQGGKLKLISDDNAVMGDDHRLGVIEFQGAEDAGSGAGGNTHSIGARIQAIARDAWDGSNNDADLEFYTTDGTTESKVLTLDADKLATFAGSVNIAASGNLSFGGVDIIDDSSGTTTLKNIDALDATTVATFEAALTDSTTDSLVIDTNRSALQSQTSAEDITALHVDFDRIVPEGGTYAHNDIGIDLDVTSASLGTSTLKGMDIDVVGATSGDSIATGIEINVSGADANNGMHILCTNEQLRLSHNAADYATFNVVDTGDLTIATFGDGTRDSDLTLDADGDIKLEPAAGNNILLDGVLTVDGRTVVPLATAHDTVGTSITIGAGNTTAGTTNNIAGGDLILQGGTGKGTGAGGDIIFQTANAGSSGSTLNNFATALTISDDLSATFTGDINIDDATTSGSSQGGVLRLISDDGAALEEDHRLGIISFKGSESGSSASNKTGARIECFADDDWSTTENGARLVFTTNDADNSLSSVLTLDSDKLATFAGDLTVNGSAINFSSATGDSPLIKVLNTTDDDQASQLVFEKLRDDDAVASGQNLGEIWFRGQDNAQNTEDYAYIIGEIDVSTHSQESGKLSFGVAAHDGTNRTGMTLTGGSLAAEVDATIGLGTASVTTVAGYLTVTGGQFTFDSVGLTAIQTNSESFADNDSSLMTSAAINDAIIKGGNITTIKVLPHQFMQNEEGGVNKSVQFDESGTIGVKSSSADGELFAFVEIPIGKTATSVTVYGSDTNNVVQVYELDINASAALGGTDGSGNNVTNASGCVVGTACDIVDVASDATNYLVIEITVTAITDIIYGAVVTVSG